MKVCVGFEGSKDVNLKAAPVVASSSSEGPLRHRLWLKRAHPNSQIGSWRPQKRYRVAARRWLLNLDSQIQHSTKWRGLVDFVPSTPPAFPWRDADWERWPVLQGSMDQGSDGVCAAQALQYRYNVNFTPHYDGSHANHNDFSEGLNQNGLRPLWLLMLVSVNLPHGPHRNDERWHQLRACMKTHYATSSEATCALYKEMSADMYATIEAAGHDFKGKKPEREVWQYLKQREFGVNKGRRTDLCRFMDSVRSAKKAIASWPVDEYERTILALESDFLQGTKFNKILTKGTVLSDAAGDGSTNPKRPTVDEKVLRGCCQNAVVISVMFLSDDTNRKLVTIAVELSSPLDEFHSWQNKLLRSVDGSVEYAISMATTGFCEHLHLTLGMLIGRGFLRKCGFLLTAIGVASNAIVCDEDVRANTAG